MLSIVKTEPLHAQILIFYEMDFAEKLKPYDINAKQYVVLIKIDENPNSSQKR